MSDNASVANNQTFDKALSFVLRWEGGYVDDPDDPGGATNKGITQNVFNNYLKSQDQPIVSVKDITNEQVTTIYQQNYWEAAHCDTLPSNLAIAQFDTAVNMGVGRAVKFLQAALGVTVDGVYNANTSNTAQKCDVSTTLKTYLDARESYYREIAQHKNLDKFLKGWLNRLDALKISVGA
ncbi:MAG: glycosyl hydrolase 108 family protein [Blastocatellia bacterium]